MANSSTRYLPEGRQLHADYQTRCFLRTHFLVLRYNRAIYNIISCSNKFVKLFFFCIRIQETICWLCVLIYASNSTGCMECQADLPSSQLLSFPPLLCLDDRFVCFASAGTWYSDQQTHRRRRPFLSDLLNLSDHQKLPICCGVKLIW